MGCSERESDRMQLETFGYGGVEMSESGCKD